MSLVGAIKWLIENGAEFAGYPERERLLVDSGEIFVTTAYRLPLDGYERDSEVLALVVFP